MIHEFTASLYAGLCCQHRIDLSDIGRISVNEAKSAAWELRADRVLTKNIPPALAVTGLKIRCIEMVYFIAACSPTTAPETCVGAYRYHTGRPLKVLGSRFARVPPSHNCGSPTPRDPCRDEFEVIHGMATRADTLRSNERSLEISTTKTQVKQLFGGHSAQT